MKKWKKKKKACPREEPVNLPQDVVYGALILTLTGHQEAYVENYRALLDYTENTIVIQGKKERIIIRGNDFLIQYFTNDDMKITGCISSIEYCNPKEQSNRW
ncbi:MAG: YabP/YqfC family sporulation protein [Lachnospiraceae bacterium]|nr:YabP/YqfC family sporulation protein [Lachnospiraceae bacterium]